MSKTPPTAATGLPESGHSAPDPAITGRPADDGVLRVQISGTWKMGRRLPDFSQMEKLAGETAARRLTFDARDLTGWDSVLLAFLLKADESCRRNGIHMDSGGLPGGVRRLLALATAVPAKKDARQESRRYGLFYRVGDKTSLFFQSARETLTFIGEVCAALMRLLRGRARFRSHDLGFFILQCGAQALPIVSLISLLVGLILAFVGAVQLSLFGAQIYVADLVGIAMVRVMGAVMAGIIMAGRTGAAFAAQLGSMQINEEIDALQTLGISPVEYLVLPRMLALALMMPLLAVYADLLGILGGLVVGVGMLDINLTTYLDQTHHAVRLVDFWVGLFTAAVFGVLVSLAGCLRGMQCGRDSAAVGRATTSAVVTGIVAIIIATAVITISCNMIGLG